jgi:hypothetical protein
MSRNKDYSGSGTPQKTQQRNAEKLQKTNERSELSKNSMKSMAVFHILLTSLRFAGNDHELKR